MQNKAVFDVFAQGFAQEFQMFYPFGQHQNLSPFPIGHDDVTGDATSAFRVVGKGAEHLLDGRAGRDVGSRKVLRPYFQLDERGIFGCETGNPSYSAKRLGAGEFIVSIIFRRALACSFVVVSLTFNVFFMPLL